LLAFSFSALFFLLCTLSGCESLFTISKSPEPGAQPRRGSRGAAPLQPFACVCSTEIGRRIMVSICTLGKATRFLLRRKPMRGRNVDCPGETRVSN
jgi:hypothetical protein